MKNPAQEPDAVPGRAISGVAVGVVVATIAGVLIAYGIGHCASDRWPSRSLSPIPAEVNAMETRVFATEAQGLEQNRRAEHYLSTYGWVRPKDRIVHIPIEVAYELFLTRQRGGRQ